MLPKKIPTYILVLIWLAGTIPYVLITFCLKDMPALFKGADKLGDLVAGFSSSFSTAFPFWFVVEWFMQRQKKHAAAKVQRRFLDRAIDMLNCLTQAISGEIKGDSVRSPDYFHAKQWDQRYEAFKAGKGSTGDMTRLVREGTPKILYIGHRMELQQQYQMILPYCGEFSSDFTNVLTAMVDEFMDEKRYRSSTETEWEHYSRMYRRLHWHLECLEGAYFREHGLPPQASTPATS